MSYNPVLYGISGPHGLGRGGVTCRKSSGDSHRSTARSDVGPWRVCGSSSWRHLTKKRNRSGCAADDRQHNDARPPSGSGHKRGGQQGFGRSKGGFTINIHFRVNTAGLPMGPDFTLGQTSDYRGFDRVMDANLPAPSLLLADRGYGYDNVRKNMQARSVVPVTFRTQISKAITDSNHRFNVAPNLLDQDIN